MHDNILFPRNFLEYGRPRNEAIIYRLKQINIVTPVTKGNYQ